MLPSTLFVYLVLGAGPRYILQAMDMHRDLPYRNLQNTYGGDFHSHGAPLLAGNDHFDTRASVMLSLTFDA